MTDYARTAPDELHRISFGPNGIALRSWHAALTEDRVGKKTFGHRWDDPQREFRALYTASSPLGAFIEALQDLRPNLRFLAGLTDLELEPGDELPPYRELDASYFDNLYACEIVVETQQTPFVDVLDITLISVIREQYADLATRLGMRAVDASAMLGADREFTQAVAREIWVSGYAGVTAPSVLGYPHTNWTAFEGGFQTNAFRVELTLVKAVPVTLDHPDLIDALNALHVSIDRNTLLLRANPGELAPADTSDSDQA
jgi:RES domain-containing protein